MNLNIGSCICHDDQTQIEPCEHFFKIFEYLLSDRIKVWIIWISLWHKPLICLLMQKDMWQICGVCCNLIKNHSPFCTLLKLCSGRELMRGLYKNIRQQCSLRPYLKFYKRPTNTRVKTHSDVTNKQAPRFFFHEEPLDLSWFVNFINLITKLCAYLKSSFWWRSKFENDSYIVTLRDRELTEREQKKNRFTQVPPKYKYSLLSFDPMKLCIQHGKNGLTVFWRYLSWY